MNKYTFTSPCTGLPFDITDDNGESYITHAVTGDKIPVLYDVERDLLCIPARYLKYIDLITPAQASELTGLSRQRICQLARSGKVDAVQVGNRLTLVSRESVVKHVEGN